MSSNVRLLYSWLIDLNLKLGRDKFGFYWTVGNYTPTLEYIQDFFDRYGVSNE